MSNIISNTVTFGIGFETNILLILLCYLFLLKVPTRCITINDILFQISDIWYTMAHNY